MLSIHFREFMQTYNWPWESIFYGFLHLCFFQIEQVLDTFVYPNYFLYYLYRCNLLFTSVMMIQSIQLYRNLYYTIFLCSISILHFDVSSTWNCLQISPSFFLLFIYFIKKNLFCISFIPTYHILFVVSFCPISFSIILVYWLFMFFTKLFIKYSIIFVCVCEFYCLSGLQLDFCESSQVEMYVPHTSRTSVDTLINTRQGKKQTFR